MVLTDDLIARGLSKLLILYRFLTGTDQFGIVVNNTDGERVKQSAELRMQEHSAKKS